jgi:hypothetical protein
MKASTVMPLEVDERTFQDKIIEYARIRGWLVHHDRPARTADGWRTAIQGDAGFPDLVLARLGRVVFAEVKTEKGTVSVPQKRWRTHLAPEGQIPDVEVFLWRPKDWPDIVKVLR